MKTNITTNQAMKIAQDYKERYNLSGTINDDINRSVIFYDEFYGVKGPAWLVLVDIEPNILAVENEYTIVISDVRAAVEHIIDPNGHPFYPHLEKK